MLKKIRENLFNVITSRLFVLFLVFIAMAAVLIYRLFYLQIVNGETYLNNFQLKIQKERITEGTRGNIYDRNGNLLAYNELAYSVVIEDVYESGSSKNAALNETLYKLIYMIEKHGDELDNDFNIILDENGDYAFKVSGTSLNRFLADVYGRTKISDLKYAEKTASAQEVIDYLCTSKYKLGAYDILEDGTKGDFIPGKGYTKKEVLQIVTIRYNMSLYSYQKYITTTIATDVSEETVAVVLENSSELEGVSIQEDTIRKYNYPYYFSHILGYTGKISQDELDELSLSNDSYAMNDTVGKSGIEAVMELELQGKKGSETIYVDNMGKVIDTTDIIESQPGNHVYLSLDKDLQVAVYNIIEQKLAGVIVDKMRNIYNYDPSTEDASQDIKIPIDDVYFALINNNVIDIEHFSEEDAAENEMAVQALFHEKQEKVLKALEEELTTKKTPYNKLTREYMNYQSYIVTMLMNKGVLISSAIDREDATYIAWTKDEVISLNEYLIYAISKNWVDITKLNLDNQYSDSSEILACIIDYVKDNLRTNLGFSKKLYQYMISDKTISGKQICMILYEQNVIGIEAERIDALQSGKLKPFDFMYELIETLQITPAQLALDPCSGSCVITDVNTGEVLALVSYPGFDINKLANGVDAEYYAKLNNDLSLPLWSAATQQKTAPGSTFKMISAVTALSESVVASTKETITCTGVFEKMAPTIHRCWIYPRSHGRLTVSGGIANSCNCFFYEVGYRLGQTSSGFNAQYGLERMYTYADMFGLSEKSGIEIIESEPEVSDEQLVTSLIGQGTHNYTTVGLARYVTTVANSGTCYNLSILDKLVDSQGNLIKDYSPSIRNTIELDDSIWNVLHSGMREVVKKRSDYKDMTIAVAGKTGTAEENKSRGNHALFVSYAPYDAPEISVTVRIPYGYTSSNAAQTAKDIYKYYYGLEEEEKLLSGTAEMPDSTTGAAD